MDRRPNLTTEKFINLIRRALVHPECCGRVISFSELCRRLRISRKVFYEHQGPLISTQQWIQLNPDAPLDAKIHYQHQLSKWSHSFRASVDIPLPTAERFFISESESVRDIKKINDPAVGTLIEIKRAKSRVRIEEVDARTHLVARIREAFITARLGSYPKISEILVSMGLDPKNPLPGLSGVDLIEIAHTETWTAQREEFLFRAFEYTPAEAELTALERNRQVDDMLYRMIQVVFKRAVQQQQNGYDERFSPAVLGLLAESRRRCGRERREILQILESKLENGRRAEGVSPHLLKFVRDLEQMTPEQVEERSHQLGVMLQLLEENPNASLERQIQKNGNS